MTLSSLLQRCDDYVHIRIYPFQNVENPLNNYDTASVLLFTLEDEILNQKVFSIGVERAKPNKDDTMILWVIIKEE